ncbi:unnamed protein product [Arctia plantaginis]|uniref:Endonuclease/exonuclease/phosphatase domain-containing protein n=1 Tax=Arctia plantaginis TaxID=874455 RepID=A0A8S0ZN84_ARCPL|nr:unnamed protein product [Arctia plantaginis]
MRTEAWDIGVVSVYLEGDKPLEPYVRWIRKIVRELGTRKILLGGDINAWNVWWGSAKTDTRGEAMEGLMQELGLEVLNRGSEPTFDTTRGGKRYTSCVDITTCSVDLLGQIDNWRVAGDVTSSDHNTILFDLKLSKAKGIDIQRTTRVYNTRKANWSQFREKLTQSWKNDKITKSEVEKIVNKEELEGRITKLIENIKTASEESIPKLSRKRKCIYKLLCNEKDKAILIKVAIKDIVQ